MKRFAVITSIVLLVLSFLVITWRLQNVVYIFLASLVITMTLERPIDLLTARGAPRWLAVLSLYGASLLGMAAIALIVFTPFIREIDPFAQDILNQFGIPYPFLLATLIALTWLIPILGGAAALLVAVLAGWFLSWSTAVMAGGATLLVLALMEYIVQPRLFGKNCRPCCAVRTTCGRDRGGCSLIVYGA